MAMLSPAVAGEAATTQAAAQACQTTALQLLLRLLPFKQPACKDSNVQLQHNRTVLLEELHKHPLWRYSSLDERSAYQTAPRAVLPQEAHNALMNYVRLAAEAEEAQRPSASHKSRRDGPLTAAEVAAELHAVYALAAAHAAAQQHESRGTGLKRLDSSEFLALLSAYASLSEQQPASDCRNSSLQQQQASSTAAAVQALYAFAALADATAQRQEQQQQQAPGQLQSRPCSTLSASSKAPAGANKQLNNGCSGAAAGTYQISSSDFQQQELEVLLKLAQLGARS